MLKNPSSACCQAFGSFVFGLGVSACACAVPTFTIDICSDVIAEKAEARPLRGEGWGLVTEKMELGIASDADPEVVVDEAGRDAVAQRRAAVVEVVVPRAAAQQTIRASRRSCGVGHAS